MIGTIRKHSKWLWLIIIVATVVSFIFWGAAPSRMGVGGGGAEAGNLGTLYGNKITAEEYRAADVEFQLSYWFRSNGEWPDKNPNFTREAMDREIYVRLMLFQKARDLGIHINQDAVVTVANEMLRHLGRDDRAVPLGEFVKQILQPRGLTAQDFENYVREYLVLEQLEQAIGLTGAFVTPEEAAADYQHYHQELSAQLVVFSASNYLSAVTVTPAAVAQFYTNYLAEYRLPDRVQVSYVAFELSNYLGAAEQKLGRTNLDTKVETAYRQVGLAGVPGAKTPEEAKAQIRESLIRQQATKDVRQQANDFASAVFSQEPVQPGNLAAIAKQQGFTVQVTAPFGAETGPAEFAAPPSFIKAAFGLSPDEPFAGPVAGPNALYVLAFGKQLPSEIPPLDQIRDQVARDYRWHEALLQARRVGTNFVHTLTSVSPDRSFASLCLAAGLQPQLLPPFSLSTRELPELSEPVELNRLKQAAFTTPPGKTSGFVDTDIGGFIVYVQAELPIDQAQMKTDLPQYIATLRRERMNESFNQWVGLEANRALRNTPVFAEQFSPGAAK